MPSSICLPRCLESRSAVRRSAVDAGYRGSLTAHKQRLKPDPIYLDQAILLGIAVPYAVGNVVMTVLGSVIVARPLLPEHFVQVSRSRESQRASAGLPEPGGYITAAPRQPDHAVARG